MVNRTDQKEVVEYVNNVVEVGFALKTSPVDVQLTVHVNNLLNTYGAQVINEFKDKLNNPESVGGQQITQLINYYGIEVVKNWFTLIYGWDFKKVR